MQRSGPMSKPLNRWLNLQSKSIRLRLKRSRKSPRLWVRKRGIQEPKKSLPTKNRDHAVAVAVAVVGLGVERVRMQPMKAKVRATRMMSLQMPMRRTRVSPLMARTNRVRAVIDPVGVGDATVML